MSQVLQGATIDDLRGRIGGEVDRTGRCSYEEARKVWNGMIDCHPGVVVRCASTQDVVAAVTFGRENDLAVAVRGGAHSTPGYSTCDDGIVIDLGPMNKVDVDPGAKTARVRRRREVGRPRRRNAGARPRGHRRARVRHRRRRPGARQRQWLARADVRRDLRQPASPRRS